MENPNSPIQTSKNQHWASIKEAGTLGGMKFLYFLYRIFGRKTFSIAMYPVALYFVLFRAASRRASFEFLTHHYQKYPQYWKTVPHYGHVLLHFHHFADVILDKLLGWISDIDESEFVLSSQESIDALMQDTRGQLIIGSHFGNLEYCRGFMQRYKNKVINILLYDKHSGNFVEMMQNESERSRLNVFQVDEFDVATIVMLQQKINQGEWVFIAGDRVPLSGLQRTVNVNFLDDIAPLPIGPYLLAKALACPVKLMFAYRHASVDNKIIFDVIPLSEKVILSQKNRTNDLENYAQQFAIKLEEHCAHAPLQWFNFYHFWQPHSHENTASQKQTPTK